jgi:hypothetical protein
LNCMIEGTPSLADSAMCSCRLIWLISLRLLIPKAGRKTSMRISGSHQPSGSEKMYAATLHRTVCIRAMPGFQVCRANVVGLTRVSKLKKDDRRNGLISAQLSARYRPACLPSALAFAMPRGAAQVLNFFVVVLQHRREPGPVVLPLSAHPAQIGGGWRDQIFRLLTVKTGPAVRRHP